MHNPQCKPFLPLLYLWPPSPIVSQVHPFPENLEDHWSPSFHSASVSTPSHSIFQIILGKHYLCIFSILHHVHGDISRLRSLLASLPGTDFFLLIPSALIISLLLLRMTFFSHFSVGNPLIDLQSTS